MQSLCHIQVMEYAWRVLMTGLQMEGCERVMGTGQETRLYITSLYCSWDSGMWQYDQSLLNKNHSCCKHKML